MIYFIDMGKECTEKSIAEVYSYDPILDKKELVSSIEVEAEEDEEG